MCELDPSKLRKDQGWKAWFNCLEKNDTMFVNVKKACSEDSKDHDHDRHRKLRENLLKNTDQKQRADPHAKREPAYSSDSVKNMYKQFQDLAGTGRTSHKFGNLHKNDRKRDTTDEPAHDWCGNKIHNTVSMQKIKQKKPQTGKKRDHRNIFHGIRGFHSDPKGGECTSYDRSRCGIHAKDKLLRGRKKRKEQNRKDRTIEPVYGRNSGNLCISHGNRNRYGGNDNAGKNIPGKIFEIIIFQGCK